MRVKLVFTDVFVNEAEIRTITGDGVIVGILQEHWTFAINWSSNRSS